MKSLFKRKTKMGKNDIAVCFFRVVVSLMMLTHGINKLMHFDMLLTRFPDPIGIGSQLSLILVVFAEVICSVFLVFGLFNRLALIPLIMTMLVAQIYHLSDPFLKKELALLYLVCYVTLFVIGLGKMRITLLKQLEEKLEAPLKKIGL